MIQELNDSLKRIADDPDDKFHIHVRERIGKKATDHFETKLKEFILSMPRLVSRIDEIMREEKEDSPARRLAKYLLLYLYDPEDYLPEKDKGLFGYLDDAYFVAVVYLWMIEKRSHEKMDEVDREIKEKLFQFLVSVRYVIPDESKKIEKTVSDIHTHRILCYSAN